MVKQSIDDLAAPVISRNPASYRLHVAFPGLVIEVRTNSGELKDKLAHYFSDFLTESLPASMTVTAIEAPEEDFGLDYTVKTPDPGKTKIKEEYADLDDGRVVKKRITGMLFLVGDDVNLAVGPCIENDNQVINFVNSRFIEHKAARGAFLFHAAGIAMDGVGLALAGFSGMGKSTLALHVMRLGADFVSNDRLLVERTASGLAMYGVAKMPRVNPGTVLNNPSLAPVIPPAECEKFRKLPIEELWHLEHKYDAFIDQCFGPGRFRLEAPLSGLVVLNWRRCGDPLKAETVNLSERRDLLPAFMKSLGVFHIPVPGENPAGPSEKEYVKLLKGCPVLEFSGGIDFEAAARHLAEFAPSLK